MWKSIKSYLVKLDRRAQYLVLRYVRRELQMRSDFTRKSLEERGFNMQNCNITIDTGETMTINANLKSDGICEVRHGIFIWKENDSTVTISIPNSDSEGDAVVVRLTNESLRVIARDDVNFHRAPSLYSR